MAATYVGCLLCCISGRLKTMLTCFPEGRSAGRRRINSNEAALLCPFVCTSSCPVADIFMHLADPSLIMCDPIISESSIFSVAAHRETDVSRDADICNFFLGMWNTPEKDWGQKMSLQFSTLGLFSKQGHSCSHNLPPCVSYSRLVNPNVTMTFHLWNTL